MVSTVARAGAMSLIAVERLKDARQLMRNDWKRMELRLLAVLTLSFLSWEARGQGTSFNYQSRLMANGLPANGIYDLAFSIWTAPEGPEQVGITVEHSAVSILDGLFTGTLDFGEGVFTGAERWLQVAVRTAGGGSFEELKPRQRVSATPYALVAREVIGGNVARLEVPNTARQAVGVVTVTEGFITAATLVDGGLGYQTPPEVRVEDATGVGAVVTAEVLDGRLQSVEVRDAGRNYSPDATLIIGAPPPNDFQTFASVNHFTHPLNRMFGTFIGEFEGHFNGYMGIGTSPSYHRLTIADGPTWTKAGWKGALELGSGAAMGWRPNAFGVCFGIGHTGGGLHFFRTVDHPGWSNTRPTYDMVISDNGHVSIGALAAGTPAPNHRLRINGGPLWTSAQWTGSLELDAGAAIGWNPSTSRDGSSQSFGIGQSDGGLYFFRTRSAPGTVASPATYDLIISDLGSVEARGDVFVERLLTARGDVLVKNRVFAREFITESDREMKENFSPVDPQEILEKVARMPITRWTFKGAPDSVHLGPMAQDFQAEFQLGSDDKAIATVDADGVALAAIQGLNQRLEKEVRRKDARLRALEERLADLERKLMAVGAR